MDDCSHPQAPQRALTFHSHEYSSLERLRDPNSQAWSTLLNVMSFPSVDSLKLLLQNYTTGEHIYHSFIAMLKKNRENAPQIFRVIVERLLHIQKTGPIPLENIASIHQILTAFLRQRSDYAELHLYWNTLKLLRQVGISISVPVLLEDFQQLPLEDRRDRMNFLAGVECCPESTARLVALCEASPDPDAADVLECVEAYADVCALWPGTDEPIICRVLRECSVACALACLQSCTLCVTMDHIRPLSQRHDMDDIRELMRVIVANRRECSYDLIRLQETFIADCWSYGVLSAVWQELKTLPVMVEMIRSPRQRIALRGRGWAYDWGEICNAGDQGFFDVASDGGLLICEERPSTAALNRLTMPRGSAVEESAVVERCVVENGANVSFIFHRRTILSRLVERGNIAAVAAALRTPYPIDFTMQHPFDTSILHIVAEMENIDTALAMLRLIVNRLRDHPADQIDFSHTGWYNRNFLSLATQCGCLALFWKEVECLPHFSTQHGRISISVRVSLNDFLQIAEEDRRGRFDFLAGVECCPESTARLVALCEASPDPDAADVLECVEAYADVCALWPGTDEPIICRVLRECSVACALACLQSLTLCLTLEHILPLSRRHDMDDIREIMRVIATDRVECRCSLIYQPIDWGTFISECWRCGVLSAVWQELCHQVPMMVQSFEECGLPVASLQGLRGWSYDWQTLCGHDPQWKKVNEGEPVILWENNYDTGALFRLSFCTHPPSEALVRRYVKGGANVNYADESGDAILHRFVRAGHVAAVKVMLEETADPIDFTLQGTGKNNVFHTLCEGNDDEVVQRILSLIVWRMQRNPNDRYDFKQKNEKMKSLLSWAALHHRLSTVFPAVKDFPFFADQLGKIELQEKVSLDDWGKMKEEDQQPFTGVRIV